VKYFLSSSTAVHVVGWLLRECTLRNTPVVLQVLEAGDLIFCDENIAASALKVDYREIVETLPNFVDDRSRNWIYVWARKSESFGEGMVASFKQVRTAAVEWVKFVVDAGLDGILEVYGTLKQSNVRGLKAVFHWLSGKLEDVMIIEVSRLLTATFFAGQSFGWLSAVLVFQKGLSVMDDDSVFALYLSLIEGLEDSHPGEEKLNAIKACMTIQAKPDLREMLLELFPIQDRSILKAGKMDSLADIIPGPETRSWAFLHQTRDDEHEMPLIAPGDIHCEIDADMGCPLRLTDKSFTNCNALSTYKKVYS
jgi:hypothetical protein